MSKGDSPTVLVLGDSISAGYGMNIDDGWVNLMNQTLAERESDWRLINASVSGETTTGGLKRLPELLLNTVRGSSCWARRQRRFTGYPTPKFSATCWRWRIDQRPNKTRDHHHAHSLITDNYTRGFEAVFAEAAQPSAPPSAIFV